MEDKIYGELKVKRKNSRLTKFLLISIIITSVFIFLFVGSIYLKSESSSTTKIIQGDVLNSLSSFLFGDYNAISQFKNNPELETFDVSIDNGLKISYKGYAITYQPLFVMDNNDVYTWAEIPESIDKKLWKIQIAPNKYKYGVDFNNVPDNIRDNLKWVVLKRTSATKTVNGSIVPMTLSDIEGKIQIVGNKIIINNKIILSHDDILSTYSIPKINRSVIVIGNLDNSWEVCDEYDENLTCIESHTEFNWNYNETTGTWTIVFDPTITISEEDIIITSRLANVTAESGDANFTHLTINTTGIWSNLVGYWNFDGDNENSKLNTSYDFTKENNDGTMVADAVVNETGCISDYGDCLQLDGVDEGAEGDSITLGNPASLTFTTKNFSISVWIKTKSTGANMGVFYKRTGSSGYECFVDTAANLECFISNGTTNVFGDVIGTSLNDGEWHFIVAVFNDSGIQGYLNGVAEFCVDTSGLIGVSDGGNAWIGTRGGTNSFFNGSIDEVMIFNTSLSATQILAIYNNQSARYVETGTQDIFNQSAVELNISTGNNKVNVTTTIENNFDSKINLSVGYYNGSWFFTDQQTIISGVNLTFTISDTSTNVSLNYTFFAGNQTNPFYSPLLQGNIVLDVFSSEVGPPVDNPPVSILSLPLDNNVSTKGVTTFECNATDDIQLKNVTLYVWNWTDSDLLFTNFTTWNGTFNSTQFTYNFTSDNNHTWNCLVFDNASQSDWASANFSLNISSVVVDTIFPSFSGFTEDPTEPTTYFNGQIYIFNSTVSSTNGTVGLEFNSINRTATNITVDVYNVTIPSLSAGNYTYYWWGFGNGTDTLFNSSSIFSYNVSRAIPQGNLTNSTKLTVIYPTETTVGLSEDNLGDADVTYKVYRDGMDLGTGETTILGVGTYLYVLNTTGGTNYTRNISIDSFTITVNQNSTYVINVTGTTPITYPTVGDFEGTRCPSELNCILYRNDTGEVTNPDNVVIQAGNYNYTFNTTGNTNYSVKSDSKILVINKATPILTFLANGGTSNLTLFYPQEINMSAKASAGTVSLDRDGQSYIANNHLNFSLAVGTYNFRANISGNANYTNIDYTNYNITIKINLGGCEVLFNETSPVIYPDTFNVFSNCTSIFTLRRNGTIVSNNSVQRLAAATYNFTVVRTDGSNYSNDKDQENFIISKATPTINLTVNLQQSNITINQGDIISLNCTNITADTGGGFPYLSLYRESVLINNGTSPIGNNTQFNTAQVENITCAYNPSQNYTAISETWFVNVSTVDSTFPQIKIIFPTNNTNTTDITININYTVSDETALSNCWYSNDTLDSNTTITCGQNITDINWIEGLHNVTIWTNDTSNNVNKSEVFFRIDTEPPFFVGLANQTITNVTALSYDINAIDSGVGLSGFRIDDTTNFSINSATGLLTNATQLLVNVYTINVTVNDTLGNTNSSFVSINVTAPTPPGGDTLRDIQHWINRFTKTILIKINNFGDLFINRDLNVTGKVKIGNSTSSQNITLFSGDGSEWNCGVNDAGLFTCGS